MNIFYLDRDPKRAADYHNQTHTIKMILECGQLMSTVHRTLADDESGMTDFYKKTHQNHPCMIWMRKSSQHYMYVYQLFVHLVEQYDNFKQHNMPHATMVRLGETCSRPPKNLKDNGFVDPPQCMPEEYQGECTVTAYRKYYLKEKMFAGWHYGIPNWVYEHGTITQVVVAHSSFD